MALQGLARDITERKVFESRLRQTQKNEAIGTLAGGIAHDFNNILTSILGFTELVIDDIEKNTLLEQNMQEIYTAGKRAKNLVKQILTFARQAEGENKPVKMEHIVKEVITLLKSTIPSTIEIKQTLSTGGTILADPTQIHQMVMNLCTNAVQAMEDDGGVMNVSLNDVFVEDNNPAFGEIKPGKYLRLSISNTGKSIRPELLRKIFDPYFTTKAPGKGTGLGLAVVQGIVKKYEGKITVQSNPDIGTVFTIYLPVANGLAANETPPQGISPSGHERILFVDDEESIVQMSKQILRRLGYNVTGKTDSLEAMALFAEDPDNFDLVVTDMTMPNMTGDKLAKALKTMRPDIKIILCTGYSKKISKDTIDALDVSAVIHKPIVRADLAGIIRNVLDEKKIQRFQ